MPVSGRKIMTREISTKIKVYNIFFIIFIFFYHCDAKFYLPGIVPLSYIIGSLGLSFFFMISGYFMFAGMTDENALKRSLKRLKTLLLPYVVWNAIFLIYFCISNPPMRETPVGKIVYRFIFQPYNDVLWYLFALFIFSIPAFLVYKILKKKIPAVICLSIVSILIVVFCVINQEWMVYNIPIGWWLTKITPYIPMYYFGGFIGLHYRDGLKVPVKTWIWPVFLVLSIGLVLLKYKFDDVAIIYWISMFTGPVILWFALPDAFFKPNRFVDVLCEPSFLIYEFQLMAFWIWQGIYKNLIRSVKWREIMVCASAYVFIYIVFYLLKFIAPHVLGILTGFRNGKDFAKKK